MSNCYVAKSIAWEFFDIYDDNEAKAWYQKHDGIYSHGSSGSAKLYTLSNLTNHLKKKHLADHEEATKKQKVKILVRKNIDKNKEICKTISFCNSFPYNQLALQ